MRSSRSLSRPASAGSTSMLSSLTRSSMRDDGLMSSSTDAFRVARDLLLTHRDDYEAARRAFAWPALDEFNWALDWFDVIADEHPERPALRIVGDDAASLSFGELKTRSGQVASW